MTKGDEKELLQFGQLFEQKHKLLWLNTKDGFAIRGTLSEL